MARDRAREIPIAKALVWIDILTRAFGLERVKGIEPSLSAWEADVLPLNYTRERDHSTRSPYPRARRWSAAPASRQISVSVPEGPPPSGRRATIATSTLNS
jgi:hypothetical protein